MAQDEKDRKPSGNQAKVNFKDSNNNIVKIIQAGKVVTYDLTKDQEAHKLLSYLRNMPSITKQLDQLEQGLNQQGRTTKQIEHIVKSQNKLLIEIARHISQDGFISIETYNQGLEKYVLENNQLKVELSRIQAQYQNTEYATVLNKAEEMLKQLDNEGYQQLLEEFKQKRKAKIQQEKREIAQAAYLQAQNSNNHFQYNKALKQIEEAIEHDINSPNYVILKGYILENLYQIEEALKIFLTIKENLLQDTLRSELYSNIGRVYYMKNEPDKALEYHKEALELKIKIFGSEHTEVASSYNDFGLVYDLKKEYDKALDYYNKDLSISLKVHGAEHPRIAVTYVNIGCLYNSKQEYDKAIEYHNKALAIELKALGAEHPAVGWTYSHIGSTHSSKQEYDKAMEYHNKALAIRLKALGTEHPDVGWTYSHIGSIYSSKQEYDKAIEYHNKALAIELKALGA
ncbi:tetratricopeptide repeat protein, partial [Telluribacter sp. SYSU D00476]|uniref:tetratricopeptide repeat protein n=1 Tax=Telluribacter sp. SYSU D00476 TaxID=2811430 RepID=UPI001FF2EE82